MIDFFLLCFAMFGSFCAAYLIFRRLVCIFLKMKTYRIYAEYDNGWKIHATPSGLIVAWICDNQREGPDESECNG